MLDKLKSVAARFDKIVEQLADPAVYSDRETLTKLSREQKELQDVVEAYRALVSGEDTIAQATQMLSDPELRELAQENTAQYLLGNGGYDACLDFETGTCRFESADFLRYLEFLKTLPASYSEALAAFGSDRGILAQAYHDGTLVLNTEYFMNGDIVPTWMLGYGRFGTDEIVRIGYASPDNTVGNATILLSPYVMTSYCDCSEEAWDFLSAIVEKEVRDKLEGIPVLRSVLKERCVFYDGMWFELYTDGSMDMFGQKMNYDPGRTLPKPGIAVPFTEETAETSVGWFDDAIGLPVRKYSGSEMAEIVNEEITAYLAGTKSAADCARVIQSRVSVWLAEHQ